MSDFLIETAAELQDIDLSRFHSVGVTAGASTPDSIIKEVLKTMSETKKSKRINISRKEEQEKPSGESFADLVDEYIDSSSDQKLSVM